jgi:hypothetical protein
MANINIVEYAKVINELAKKHPKAIVICSSDDEGNSFSPVVYHPAPGHYTGGRFGEFEPANENPKKNVNAICVN